VTGEPEQPLLRRHKANF